MTRPTNTRSQVKALLWEEGRVGGAIAGAFLVVGLLLILIGWYPPNQSNPWRRNEFLLQFATLGVPMFAALLLVLNPDYSGHLVGGFSKRVLRLPVQTHVAVAVSLFARTLLVAAVSFSIVGLSSALFDDAPGIAAAGLITLLYLIAQLADWLRGPISGLTSLIVLGVLGVVFYALWPGTPELSPITWGLSLAARSPLILPGAVVVVALLAYGISAIAVHADRIGHRYGVPEIWDWPKRIRVAGPARTRPFQSPMAAQVWFELRRAKWSLPLSAVLGFLLLLGAAWVAVRSNRNNHDDDYVLRTVSFYAVFGCVIIGAGVHGVITRVLGFRKPAGISGYEYLQPLTDAQFAAARVIAGALMLGLTLLPALMLHLAVAGRLFVTELLPEALRLGITSPREVVWIFLSRGLLVGLMAWSLLAIGTRLFRWAMGAMLALSILAFLSELAGITHIIAMSRFRGAGWILTMCAALTLVICAIAVAVYARRRQMLSRRDLAFWMSAWALLAWLFHYALYTTGAPEPLRFAEHLLAILSAVGCSAPLPLVYFATLLDLHRRRHGKTALQDAGQYRSVQTPGRASRARIYKFAATAVVALAAIWLGWPATPAFIEYRRALGQPVTLSDLNAWYAEPPPGENVAPEYVRIGEQAARLKHEFERQRFVQLPNAVDALDYAKSNLLIVGPAPFARDGIIDGGQWKTTEAYWAEVTSKVAPTLKALAARDTLKSRYPVDFTDRSFYFKGSNHTSFGHNCNAELTLDALHWTIAGRPGDAVDSLLAILALVDSYRNEPALWTQYDRMRMLSRASVSLETVLNRSVPGESDLNRLQLAFARSLSSEQELSATERAVIGDVTVYLSPDSPYGYYRSRDLRNTSSLFGQLAYPEAGFRMAMLLEAQGALEGLRQPWQRVWQAYESRDTARYYTQIAFLAPVMSGSFGNYHWTGELARQARVALGMATTGIAIERFRLANQTLPTSLTELVPTYLSAIPDDAFAPDLGVPLRYLVRESGEYVVYSVAYDKDDDGGDANMKNNRDGDIAFTVAPMSFRTGSQIAGE